MASIVLSAKYSHDIGHWSSHFHDCHQLIFIEEGHVCVTVNDKIYHAGPGSLIITNRFETHSIQIESDVYKRYTLRFRPDLSGRENKLLSILVNRPENFRHVLDLSAVPEIPFLLKAILKEWTQQDDLWEKQLDYCLYSLLICLHRCYPELQQTKSETLKLVQSVQTFLEENYALPCCLDSLAQKYHMSASHLSHTFKKITGQSVIGYLSACRFAAAKRLLCETDMEISDIVSACGFSDCSNFSRSFRALSGMSPSQFRAHNKH